jgi:phosphatidylserine/phosphatidylglycerophosphate/cardiolipin synthase-like enzyme
VPRSVDQGDTPGAVLHAKAVVQDSEQVFVASANLTPNALTRNIQAGLLVRDRSLAQTIASYFQRHMETGLVVPLPPVG